MPSVDLSKTAAFQELEGDARILAWRTDPLRFWADTSGFKPVSYQARVAKAVAGDQSINPSNLHRFCLASGHNVGKSALLANLAMWYSWMHPGSVVLITGPTFEKQVVNLFYEIRKWYGGFVTSGLFELEKARVRWPRLAIMDEQKMGKWQIVGMSASEPQNLAGEHSPQGVMVIIDEASVVDDGVFNVLEGALSDSESDVRLVMAGNPTRREGEFYRAAFDPKYADTYWRLQISSYDSEVANTSAWGLSMLRRHGENSPIYRCRVLGLPPDDNPSAYIPLDWVLKAEARWEDNSHFTRPERAKIGVDVAWEGGDETAICIRRGNRVEGFRVVTGYDPVEVAEEAAEVIKGLNGAYDNVYVDSIGYGGGVVANLKRLSVNGKPIRVVPVNVSRRSTKPDEFFNLRAELYCRLRSFIQVGEIPPATPDDDKLRADLVGIRTDFAPGKLLIESKDQIRKRNQGRSPDRADALMLTFAQELGTDWASVLRDMEADTNSPGVFGWSELASEAPSYQSLAGRNLL